MYVHINTYINLISLVISRNNNLIIKKYICRIYRIFYPFVSFLFRI